MIEHSTCNLRNIYPYSRDLADTALCNRSKKCFTKNVSLLEKPVYQEQIKHTFCNRHLKFRRLCIDHKADDRIFHSQEDSQRHKDMMRRKLKIKNFLNKEDE